MTLELKKLKRPESGNVVRIDNPADYTSGNAGDRVLFVNLWFVKFGTTDKLQGAAIFLTVLFLVMAIVVIFVGLFGDKLWAKEALSWLTTPLMLVVGVAVGRGSKDKKPKD